jgi:hypothetical protein
VTGTAYPGDFGELPVSLAPHQLLKLDVTAEGYLAGHFEFTPQRGGFDTPFYLYPVELRDTLFVGFREDQGYLHVHLVDTRECATSGAVVSVVGHPELVAAYSSDFQRFASSDPWTSVALIGPVPPGTYQLTASEHGAPCQPLPWNPGVLSFSPTVDVEPNEVSFVELNLTPQP